ncbi:unnamed protein product [Schistocephalus solidus]|uniref:Mediator of RNA polymerase II transcription subunit 13 n=1 Tax=Schistocephalus solidus TaxID=70667 RepID=A0A183SAP8_SCHSO|nr:unnamed protein product [Schistocephalus solidus]
MVNALPQSVRFHHQIAPFTGSSSVGGLPRPPEMASAPEVSLSRRNHPDMQDYVKSWSLDAARYRPKLLPDDHKDPFPTLLVPPLLPDEVGLFSNNVFHISLLVVASLSTQAL